MWQAALIEGIGKLFKSKYFWYILIALIILTIVRKQWKNLNSSLGRTFNKDKNYEKDAGGGVIPVREVLMKELASKLQIEINSIGSLFNTDDDLIIEISNLNDQDLEYMAKYYSSTITRDKRNQMYLDIKNESIIGDVDELILNRLSALGLA